MRTVLSVIAAASLLYACAYRPKAPADELPPTAPTQGQEPIQEVPAEPGGPATPLPETPAADAGTTDAGTSP